MTSKLGWQTQHGGPVALSMMRAAPPGVLKLMNEALANGGVELALEWRRRVGPLGILVYRRVYAPGADLAQMPKRTVEVLADADRLRAAGPVAVESPFNEELANGPGLADLVESEVAFVDAVTSLGHDAVVMVLPEGNPANRADVAQPRIVDALRKMRAIARARTRRVYFGWHGYSMPKLGPHDPDHLLRYRSLLELLPPDVHFPVLIGETGFDGGIEGRARCGYLGYGWSAKRYAEEFLAPLLAEIDGDDRVAGAAVFGVAMNQDWALFDLHDELDARPVFARNGWLWKPKEGTMRLGLLYRMGSDVPETSVAELADLCRRGGFSAISPKAMDGDAWEGQFDGDDQLAIKNAYDLQNQVIAYSARGIAVEPWVVYRGFDAGAEATAHATVGRICRTVVVDFEWRYPGFADKGSWDDAVRYFRLLREGAPGVRIVFCPDPRQVRRGEYAVADVLPYVDVVSPQVYWTDFQQSWDRVLDDGLSADYGGRDVWPMLPGNSEPEDLGAALSRLENEWHSAKPPTAYVFQRVGLREENLPVLAEHAQLGGGPIEKPTEEDDMPLLKVDKDAYERDFWSPIYAQLAQNAQMVEKLRATGNHADALLADAIEKAGDGLRPVASLHKIICGAEAA